MSNHRSVSQDRQYRSCPEAYRLQRIVRAWERPAAWTVQGSAVHETIEYCEKYRPSIQDLYSVYVHNYAEHVNKITRHTPNMDSWFNSGSYRGWVDTERRFIKGWEQVQRYLTYRDRHLDEMIWTTPSDELAIELSVDIGIGDVRVLMYIDQVIVTSDGRIVVRDIKTGQKPGDDFQLSVYARAIERVYGVTVSAGDYWMAVSGKPTIEYPLSWSWDELVEEFRDLDEKIRAEEFPPNPGEHCRRCPVALACDHRAW